MASRRGGARELVLRYVADARQFIGGTRDAARAADSFADDLDNLTADERRAAREAERVARALDKLDRAGDRAGRSMRDLGDDTRKAGTKLGDVGSEVGGEFTENFGEAMRSGDPFGALVETATSLGPALGAAGVAAAAAFGIGKKLYDESQRFAKAARQVGADMVDALRDGMLDATEREGLLQAALGVDTLPDALRKAEQLARKLGVPARDVLTYLMTAGTSATPALTRALRGADDEVKRLRGTSEGWYAQLSDGALAADDLARYTGAAAQGLADANRWATDLNTAAKNATGPLSTAAVHAAEIARQSRNARDYWSQIERATVRSGLAAPGQVRAERWRP